MISTEHLPGKARGVVLGEERFPLTLLARGVSNVVGKGRIVGSGDTGRSTREEEWPENKIFVSI